MSSPAGLTVGEFMNRKPDILVTLFAVFLMGLAVSGFATVGQDGSASSARLSVVSQATMPLDSVLAGRQP